MDNEYIYIGVITLIIMLPKILLRFKIPSGISAFLIGFILVNFSNFVQADDELIKVLARLGITSLFLFAGLEIDIEELKKNSKPLLKFNAKFLLLLSLTSVLIYYFLNPTFQVAILTAVALVTPSAGFILSSLSVYKINDSTTEWVKMKAISKEVASIIVLLFTLQITQPESLLVTLGVLIALIIILPIVFSIFLNIIAPYAQDSEVSFLVILAFTCGILTKKLGTHYLVGAFITGIIAGRFEHFNKGREAHRILDSLASFFSIFVPFYFFSAGMLLKKELLSFNGFLIGLVFCIVLIPLRVKSIKLATLKFIKNDDVSESDTSHILLPNLIFGFVVASILTTELSASNELVFGIIFYTIVASIVPSITVNKKEPRVYDTRKV